MPIDATRPYRRPSERLALVEAILALPAGAQETDWLEWKSTLDLTAKADRAKLAKHIIAFANRTPAIATRACGGYAYIAVGVEPQQLHGIEVVDSAMLDQGLQPYLGTGGGAPIWALEWVAAPGAYVLVIEVAAPEPGMPIYGTRGQFEGVIRINEIYVRRKGRSERATIEEVQALADRRAAGAADTSLDVAVDTGRPPAATVPRWRWDSRADDAVVSEARDVAEGWRPAKGIGPAFLQISNEQLADYADELEEVALHRALALACQYPGARVDLTLRNLTDRPFQGVRVEVRMAGVAAVADADVPEVPVPPQPGIPRYLLGYGPDLGPDLDPDPDIVYVGDEAVVRFEPVDLRPGTTYQLPPFWAVAVDREDAPAPGGIALEWRAAAMNATGSPSGDATLTVADRVTVTSGLSS